MGISDAERPDPDPTVIEFTADTGRCTEAIRRVQAGLMFAFHPDLSTAAEREARYAFLRAHAMGDEFAEQMQALRTQNGISGEQLAGLRSAILRLSDARDGDQPNA